MRRMAAAMSALAVAGVALAAASPAGASSTFAAAASPATGIGHVFLVVIENEGFDKTFGSNPNPYLPKTLRRQGTLLTNYYGIGHESNPNYLALLSGQAPNPQTQADCQIYDDFQPAPAVLDADGQAVGTGCVFPRNVPTLADQLDAKHVTWHGYMQDMGNDLSRDPDRCGQPAFSAGTGFRDGTQKATAKDSYAARHNPFVYFHSVIDDGSCERNVVPLTHLLPDLKSVATTPRFNLIIPNLCNDGHDAPCAGKDVTGSSAGGLTSVDHFLSTYVPKIQASPAFKKDGLLLVIADESDGQDATSCCGEKAGPDSPFPGIYLNSNNGQGGGRVGALAVGRCVRRGATTSTGYNHYSLLRSLEDLYGVRTGGTDGHGHIGFAAADGLKPLGPDVFAACPKSATRTSARHAPAVRAGSTSGTTNGSSAALASTGAPRSVPLAAAMLVLLALVVRRSRPFRRF